MHYLFNLLDVQYLSQIIISVMGRSASLRAGHTSMNQPQERLERKAARYTTGLCTFPQPRRRRAARPPSGEPCNFQNSTTCSAKEKGSPEERRSRNRPARPLRFLTPPLRLPRGLFWHIRTNTDITSKCKDDTPPTHSSCRELLRDVTRRVAEDWRRYIPNP